MPVYHTLLIDGDEQTTKSTKYEFLQLQGVFFGHEVNPEDKDIENLVYQIVKMPGNLLLHLQRIFACYKQNKPEQLYAALVDFLNILAGKGRSLATRMVIGASGRLTNEHSKTLQLYLKDQWYGHLPVNPYSVLTEDLVGTFHLIDKTVNEKVEHDYLQLAHDYIQYSQLDSAMGVLEEGVERDSSREDIQEQLLELYQLTDNETRFRSMYASASKNKCHLISGWEKLEHYFNGRKK